MLAYKAKELDTINTMVTMGKVSAAKIGLACFILVIPICMANPDPGPKPKAM